MIRRCTIDDVLDLQYICKETFSQTFAEENSKEDMEKFLESAYNIELLKKELQDENSMVYLSYEDGKINGYLKLNKFGSQTEDNMENSLELQRIYILNSAKGSGIGTQFMNIAIDVAKENNVDYIWLGVWEHNYPALKFYKSKGFVPFSSHIFTVGTDEQTDILMKKYINQ